MMTYPASTGRHFDEILRVIDALQLTEAKNVATPVNWKKGDKVVVDISLSDKQADQIFGSGGYQVQELPSEKGKDLDKHYMRWTNDPSGAMTSL